MIPEEAIKNLQARVAGEFSIQGEDDCADIKLGIEALKWYKGAKEDGCIRSDYFLPGETHIPENIGKLPSDDDIE